MMRRLFRRNRTLTATGAGDTPNNPLIVTPDKVAPPPDSPDWELFLRHIDQHRNSVLHVGFDKEGIPFYVKARPSGNYVYIEFCSPRFDYNPSWIRADLRYDKEDQCKGRLYIVIIDVPASHISKGFGTGLMRGILRYAQMQGVDFVEGEQRWNDDEQRQRQVSYYSKYGFEFIRDPERGKTYLRLDLRKRIDSTD